MGTYNLGTPVDEGTMYRGAVAANALSYSGVVGAVEYVSWNGLDDDEDVSDENEFDEDEFEGVEKIVVAEVPKRKPGRPKKVVAV